MINKLNIPGVVREHHWDFLFSQQRTPPVWYYTCIQQCCCGRATQVQTIMRTDNACMQNKRCSNDLLWHTAPSYRRSVIVNMQNISSRCQPFRSADPGHFKVFLIGLISNYLSKHALLFINSQSPTIPILSSELNFELSVFR